MTDDTIDAGRSHVSPRAVLASLGVKLRQLQLWDPIQTAVHITQKKVKYTPTEKLWDAWLGILAGAHGLVEINKRVRPDVGLQRAFGRTGCAEQSVVQDTLDACTAENVVEMYTALNVIYRRHSAGYRHQYEHTYQILDVDLTGLPCGRKAALATKGYFAKQRNRRGRQLGRVLATRYNEVVIDRVFPGATALVTSFCDLVQAAAQTLDLDAAKRARTILRVDSGAGSVANINWALARGYQYHGKDYSGQRATRLAESVTEWVADPRHPGREVGWVTLPTDAYVCPVRRLAVRCRQANGHWGIGVLVTTLTAADALALTHQPCHLAAEPHAGLLALVYFYDLRGGGVETSYKGDIQGLGIRHRNKKRWAAQQMVSQLNALAHNVLVWAQSWLTPGLPQLRDYGSHRLVRDILTTTGYLFFDHTGRLVQCVLNAADPFAPGLVRALSALLASEQVAVNLGET